MAEANSTGGDAVLSLFDSVAHQKRKSKGDRKGQQERQKARIAIVRAAFDAGTYVPGSYTREANCEGCGVLFPNWRSQRMRFCSRSCAFAWKKANRIYATRADAKRAEKRRARERKGLARWPQERQCDDCQAAFVAATPIAIRCQPCREKRLAPRPKITRNCEDCGTEITGTAAKRSCRSCSRKRARLVHRQKYGATKRHRQRARKFGVEYEPIEPAKVFGRDRWRCQVCGVKTPKRLRGTLEPNAPELDHRVPMAMGGSHTWDNVQCCCRACNLAKGATQVLGQLPLFAKAA